MIFRSLIRILELSLEDTFARQHKKNIFYFVLPSLNRILELSLEETSARQHKKNNFYFVLPSLNRIFAAQRDNINII